ncbi:MAG: YidC/Oxa1 family membrane protein insertase [Lachnospiraceae bacterium]|nr:YidC/Oxa1 family membrane protein insertase [Lachnospiraceae bacterium]
MVSVFLTQTGGILGPFAKVLGWILNAIYEFVSLFGIENIAICIILFTFVTKMLMIPLTIKQQRYTKLSAVMNPEIQAIQDKYKGKKDDASMRRQQMEMQEVYNKYGSSPTAGCLPMLITFPILFALYRVIYAIPAYVNDVGALYQSVGELLQPLEGYAEYLMEAAKQVGVSTSKFSEYSETTAVLTMNHIIDILTKFSQQNWADLGAKYPEIAAQLQPLSNKIIDINSFVAGMNILDPAGYKFPGIIIPLLAAGFQFLQSKLMTVNNNNNNNTKKNSEPNQMADSMKMMNNIMPIMSGVFCIMLPIGVGLYWVASSVFTILQQLIINRYLDKADINEMIEKNVMKANKKKAKLGIETGNKMAEVAKTPTKTIERKYEEKSTSSYANAGAKKNYDSYKRSEVSYSAKSIAANANILRDRSKDKEKDKGDK